MKPYRLNPRQISQKHLASLRDSLESLGDLGGIVENVAPPEVAPLSSGQVVGGHQRLRAMFGEEAGEFALSDADIEIIRSYDCPTEQGTIAEGFIIWRGARFAFRRVVWDDETFKRANFAANQQAGEWNWDMFANTIGADDLTRWGYDPAEWLAQLNRDAGAVDKLIVSNKDTMANMDAEPRFEIAEELREKWGTARGQVWRLGSHRVMCGDCTDAGDVARLMDGARAALIFADPPYGMGKEAEGIANDNLYNEKLDSFQMAWYAAVRPGIADNASVYIWGTAENLWRLWYVGGLRERERITFRNEIVWRKPGARGITSQSHRMYPTASERCLFFMLGEQELSRNADNYWEGWNAIIDYLETERQKANWTIKDTKRIAGHSEKSGCHWFDKSQWMMPTKEVYLSWQRAANGRAFTREYDELAREFYASRAYFDNTHDAMTDVWDFSPVLADERFGHATPKPLKLVERAIKTSAPDGAIVIDPFLGSGTTLIACENLGRLCYGMEIEPKYVAVSIQRWVDATGGTPELQVS